MSSVSRRTFLKLGAAASLAAGSVSFIKDTTQLLELSSFTIPLPHLPKSFDGYRIGFLSDLHLNPCLGTELAENAVRLLNKEHLDLIILGGDYILMPEFLLEQKLLLCRATQPCPPPHHTFDQSRTLAKDIYRVIAQVLGELHAADGVFGVLGNHELWVSATLCLQAFAKTAIRMLVNREHRIQRGAEQLLVYGTDDFLAGLPTWPKEQAPSVQEVRLLVSHNPDLLSEALRFGRYRFDLGLAGHTHGGQIKIPGIGALHYNIRDTRLAEGLVTFPTCHTFTSRGVGVVGPPIRLNCPPEVSVLTLKRA